MTEIEWLAPARIIPGHGEVTKGQRTWLPSALAERFIAQGEAQLAPLPVTYKKSTTKEVDV